MIHNIIYCILTFLHIQSSEIKHIHIMTQTSPSPRFFHHPELKLCPLNITHQTPSHSNPSKNKSIFCLMATVSNSYVQNHAAFVF